MYSYVEKYDRSELLTGEFSRLQQQGLPEARAEFFIDPWGAPYWVRHQCSSEPWRQTVFIYSFGPNRRRDSGRWNILRDDVGEVAVDSTADI